MKKLYVVEFEIELIEESPAKAYALALDKLGELVKKQKALGVAEIFDEAPNGGIDGSSGLSDDPNLPSTLGWKCIFAIREKSE